MVTAHRAKALYLVKQMVSFQVELSTKLKKHCAIDNYHINQVTAICGIISNCNGL